MPVATQSPGNIETDEEENARRKRHVRTLLLWLAAAYWIALFIATHLDADEVKDIGGHLDKVLHFVAYGGLTFLLCALFWARGWSTTGTLKLVVPLLLCYGAVDEVLQPFVGRTADVLDWLADGVGIGLGCAVFLVVRTRLERWFPLPQ